MKGPINPLIDVNGNYYSEPAPMGIADYGEGSSGPYEYATNSSLGIAGIVSLSTTNSTGSPWMSIQQNVNLQFTSSNRVYVYWVQDVAELNTKTNTIYFQNNIWNSTTVSSQMSASGVSGGGQIYPSSAGSFYDAVARISLPGNLYDLVYPTTVEFRVNSSVDALKQPVVTFEYNDGYGWQEFDAVSFISVHLLTALPGFLVDGFAYKPGGFYDSELILGGPGDGSHTSDVQSNVRLQLEFWNGHNYQEITHAYNFGSDTAEGISNVLSQWYYYLSNGGIIAQVQPGSGTLGVLWDQSGISVIDVKTSTNVGTLDVANASFVGGSPGQFPFQNGEVVITLEPGTYTLQLYSGTTFLTSGKYAVTAGQLLQLKTPLGIVPLTLSYAVVGGGSGYSPPVLTYSYNGIVQTTPLTSTPTAYEMDSGTTWSVSQELTGSTGIERWQTSQLTTGSASSTQTMAITYYHQYLLAFSYSATGGGSGYSAPTLKVTQFGLSATENLGTASAALWIDSGTSYSTTNPLPGSTGTERWFASPAQGSASGPAAINVVYANQYLFTAIGAGSSSEWFNAGSSASYTTLGVTSPNPDNSRSRITSYSIDGGPQTSVVPTIGNVSLTITMNGPHTVTFASVTQFLLSIPAGAQSAVAKYTPPTVPGDTYWYDAGTQVSVTLNGVFGRSAGTGSRIASYGWNGGQATKAATSGEIVLNTTMSSAQLLNVTTVDQYEVSLDPAASSLLSSATAPTIVGDSYWYDAGTPVSISLDGVFGRVSGTGVRLSSYSVNGASTSVDSTSVVSITIPPIYAPIELSASTTTQYLLTLSGEVASETPPSIPGDAGWYDSDTPVTVAFDNVWNSTTTSRSDAVGYSVDGSHVIPVPRSDKGTFVVAVLVSGQGSISVSSIKQYSLQISGGDGVKTDPLSPTNDSFFDNGSNVVVSSNYSWDIVNGTTRQNLNSYIIDGQAVSVPREDTGNYTTSQILMSSAHMLSFSSVTQYLESFSFLDASGSQRITPSVFSIDIAGRVQQASDSAWLDNGTSFTISNLTWEGSNVTPPTAVVYAVNHPANITIDAAVYPTSLRVVDEFGLRASGAVVTLKLANGTQVAKTTNSSGVSSFGLIPLGTYSGTVSSGLVPSSFSGTSVTQAQATVRVLVDVPLISVAGLASAMTLIIGLAKTGRLRGNKGPSPS